MGKNISKKNRQRNKELNKILFVFKTIITVIITGLLFITTPTYSEGKHIHITTNVLAKEEKNEINSITLFHPISVEEERLQLLQQNIVKTATSEIGTCGYTAIQKYSLGKSSEWCSEFVSWVYKETEIPFFTEQNNTSWMLVNSQQIAEWFKENNRFHYSSSDYIPQIGDYVQTRNLDGELHSAIIIDIVKEPEPETEKTIFVTIDGNWNNCVTQVKKYKRSNMIGFGEISID